MRLDFAVANSFYFVGFPAMFTQLQSKKAKDEEKKKKEEDYSKTKGASQGQIKSAFKFLQSQESKEKEEQKKEEQKKEERQQEEQQVVALLGTAIEALCQMKNLLSKKSHYYLNKTRGRCVTRICLIS